jgi:hypothetical protein
LAQTAIISFNSVSQLIFVAVKKCVFFEVRTELLNELRMLAEVSMHPQGPATGQHDQRFSVVFLGPTANAELISKFDAVLHASQY